MYRGYWGGGGAEKDVLEESSGFKVETYKGWCTDKIQNYRSNFSSEEGSSSESQTQT